MNDRRIEEVRVTDVLTEAGKHSPPATVRSDSRLRDAVDAILSSETRKVYVLDLDGKLVGTITLETLLRHAGYRLGVRKAGVTSFLRMLAEMSEDQVTGFMNSPVRILGDELLVNATRLMVEAHLNDLPVVDSSNTLIGELNGLDILRMSREW